jgi:site-specific recombinase XerD
MRLAAWAAARLASFGMCLRKANCFMTHENQPLTQQIINNSSSQDSHLATLAAGFLMERKTRNVTDGTIEYYRDNLKPFLAWADAQAITDINQLTPAVIREYIFFLEEAGHNPGGIHAFYRTLRAFLRWYADEFDRLDFNPLRKVKAPKVPQEPLIPVSLENVRELLQACKGDKFTAIRDRIILLFLLDTGARANEVLQVNRDDLNTITGDVLIRQGKGRKPRTVFLGHQSRRAMRAYLKQRDDKSAALFVTNDGERLTYNGLRAVITRRAKIAGIKPPSLHSFRRAFALNMLRNGIDLITLSRLMGHTDLQILKRYLAQNPDDLRAAHSQASPVDKLL